MFCKGRTTVQRMFYPLGRPASILQEVRPFRACPRIQRNSLALRKMTNDRIVPFSSDDSRMEAAIDHAKSTIKEFFDAYCNPTTQQTGFLLKVVFDEGDQREHIWLADLEFTGELPSGVVANEPDLPSLSFMRKPVCCVVGLQYASKNSLIVDFA